MALIDAYQNRGQDVVRETVTQSWDSIDFLPIFIILLILGVIIGGTILIVKLVELINEKKEFYKNKGTWRDKKEGGK